MDLTYFNCGNDTLNKAYYTAVGDLVSNIKLFKGGLLGREMPVVIAGMGYWTPWTRDAAINCSNAVSLLFPGMAENTLVSVLEEHGGKVYIGGEYWDKIIWTSGAWEHYLTAGGHGFLKLAYEATVNTLEYMEATEFDPDRGLFRGPACYGDGVAAYPDRYAVSGESGIISFAQYAKKETSCRGEGIPMFTLSTNCLYYMAYKAADMMADELGLEKKYEKKAAVLKAAVNKYFYIEEKHTYRYMVDDCGGCDAQEGMGISLAILSGIAGAGRSAGILSSLSLTDQGVACVSPSFARYSKEPGQYGRHSGTVWPHIEAFLADAAHRSGRDDIFEKELFLMAERAVRDGHFAEIYHPDTGEIYGGLQELGGHGIVLWDSQKKQTWSATGFLRLIFRCILGLEPETDEIRISPFLPEGMKEARFTGLRIKNAVLDITISGSGGNVTETNINGQKANKPCLPAGSAGRHEINIVLS